MSEETKTPRETLFSYPGPDSIFAIERDSNRPYGSISIVENINGAESIELGSVNKPNVGRLLTWIRRMHDHS